MVNGPFKMSATLNSGKTSNAGHIGLTPRLNLATDAAIDTKKLTNNATTPQEATTGAQQLQSQLNNII